MIQLKDVQPGQIFRLESARLDNALIKVNFTDRFSGSILCVCIENGCQHYVLPEEGIIPCEITIQDSITSSEVNEQADPNVASNM